MPTTSPAKASSASERSWAKKNCGAESDRLARSHELRPHAPLELTRADAQEGDAVAMVGVHVGLDLEHEARHLRFVRLHRAGRRFLRARARREFGQSIDEVFDAEILERAAKQDRGHMALEERLLVESLQALH